jgi:hypothetical protein
MTVHTREQGIRLHYLANLGGLVAVAGLDGHTPDLLLGLLLTVAARVPQLTPAQRTELRARGQARLEQRGAEKRAWSAWRRAQELHRVDLSAAEIQRLLTALGAMTADLTDGEPAEALLRALRGPR